MWLVACHLHSVIIIIWNKHHISGRKTLIYALSETQIKQRGNLITVADHRRTKVDPAAAAAMIIKPKAQHLAKGTAMCLASTAC